MASGVLSFRSDLGERFPELLIEKEWIVAKAARAPRLIQDQAGGFPSHHSHVVPISPVQHRHADVTPGPVREWGVAERREKIRVVGLFQSEVLETPVGREAFGSHSGCATEEVDLDAGVVLAAEDVEVEMGHLLAAVAAVIGEDAVAGILQAQVARDPAVKVKTVL